MLFWLEKCRLKIIDSNKEITGKIKIHDLVKTPREGWFVA